MKNRAIIEETAFSALTNLGYKILLRHYECELGEIDFVAKRAGKLIFIGINRIAARPLIKAGEYYMKRYGIQSVEPDYEFFEVA